MRSTIATGSLWVLCDLLILFAYYSRSARADPAVYCFRASRPSCGGYAARYVKACRSSSYKRICSRGARRAVPFIEDAELIEALVSNS